LAEQRGVPVHEVEIADDSLLRKLAGVRRLEVNRIHHQAVERPAPGLRPVAWAGDRTIEALELSAARCSASSGAPRTCSTTPASGRCGWWQGPSGFRTPLTPPAPMPHNHPAHRVGEPEPGALLVGAEEEFLLIDATTGRPAPRIAAVLPDALELAGSQAQEELHQAQIELATSPCADLADLRAELLGLRSKLVLAAAPHEAVVVASGPTPPRWVQQAG